MDVVYSHVCGLDVHKKNIVACTITPEGKETRTFGIMTDDLISEDNPTSNLDQPIMKNVSATS